MATNQGHHVGSLTNDYAILARFAHDDHENTDEQCSPVIGAEEDGVRFQAHRRSFPSSYIQPSPSTIPSMDFTSDQHTKHSSVENGMTETTPLLGPLVPRISEEQPGDDDDIKSNTTMFWEEMRTLSKYTLPVFGSVSFMTHLLNDLRC
jgi:MATE family multidrug resistance protein